MRSFFLEHREIFQTASAKLALPEKVQTMSAKLIPLAAKTFPLLWSHDVRLLGVKSMHARGFYEAEALRGGWTHRQLDRQIQSPFYERTALSRNKASMLTEGSTDRLRDAVTPEEVIKDPLVLEFLDLKDEYSESATSGTGSILSSFIVSYAASSSSI